jgi:serine/threonine protein kinase, bacterial
MPLGEGSGFAGYTVIRLLGVGGMGEVYLVQHPRMPRREALKILPSDVSSDPEFRARFEREADLASALYHPHIIGVHDRGEYEGQLWISMDYVDGLDAARLLSNRYPTGMALDQVMRIVTAVASALDYAHKQGLLHRDVKPANIVLTHLDDEDQQRILLADFGIARNINDISGLTATNMTVGTVAYAAPEQLMGEEIDGRADIYALAATTYHLLTGSQLFPNSNPAVVISRHLNAPVPTIADSRPELANLDPVLARALAKDPADRYGTATEFARALAGENQAAANARTRLANEATGFAAAGRRAATPPPSPRSSPRTQPGQATSSSRWLIAAAAGGALILACVAVLVWALMRPYHASNTQAEKFTSSASATPSSETASPTAAAPPPPPEPVVHTALPACYRGADKVEAKPTSSDTACRMHWFENLTWTSWTPTEADGAGTENLQNCTPDCASGEIWKLPVQVQFSDPQPPPTNSGCPADMQYYSNLLVVYQDKSPSSDAFMNPEVGEATRYNGMAAFHWWSLTPVCDPSQEN